jgi:hypothetical protein
MDTLVGKDEGNIHLNICTTLCEADHGTRSGSCASFTSRVNNLKLLLRGQLAKGWREAESAPP